MRRAILGLCLLAVLPAVARAQHGLARHGSYDARVPTPRSVLGYEPGERLTPHHLLVRYAEAVATASPRVRLDTVALTFEGREVLAAFVTSERNQQRLDAIRAEVQRLADPRALAAGEAETLIGRVPVVVWLGYTVHGNEASGAEAALALLYQLAAGEDAETRAILDSTVVIIDPVQNPDGHERYVQDVLRMRPLCPGCFGGADVPTTNAALVHQGSWPGARTSHYLFDLNRDWFLMTHPETRGRARVFLSWFPHVAADLHEMGANSTYFFSPPMDPVNQNVHGTILKWWDIYAAANAAALDRHGESFFRREGYDEFYPGYGTSWPLYTGAAGMTYEQASSGAGAIRRTDGTILTLRHAARNHYATSFATALTSAQRRTERLRDYFEFRRTAVTEAPAGARSIVLAPDAQGRADSLVALLLANGIEVQRALRSIDAGNARSYWGTGGRARIPAGAWVVDLAQPQGRLAKALLEPDAELDRSFIEEELESRRTGRGDRFYDVTAWALPYLYRVPAWQVRGNFAGLEPVADVARFTPLPPARSAYAYAFEPGSEASLRMLGGLLADSVRVWHATRAFRAGGQEFRHGAFIVRVAANDSSVHAKVAHQVRRSGARVTPLATAMAEAGTDLGSNSVRFVPAARVALAGGTGVAGNAFGFAWYALEQRLQYPVVPVSLNAIAGPALNDYDVLVLPSAPGLDGALGDAGKQRLVQWVRDGGVLIAIEGATGWLASERSGLSRFRTRRDTVRADSAGGAPLPADPAGAILRVHADTLSPLLAGVHDVAFPVLMNTATIYTAPDDLRAGEVVLRYAPEDELRIAGYLWPELPERIGGSPYLWTERLGSGRIIAFTGDPNWRAAWRGLLPIFGNAVLLGNSF
ncbi:MAG TPA: M14 family zinc carboxypeptidase [Longimicrobiales bacterium]|nr:M14 family zinc carboxypeptidase [Longimicrobiales bacterium]